MKNREKCQPNLTDPNAYEQQLQQKCKGQALRLVEPWLLAFVNPDAKQAGVSLLWFVMHCLGKVSTATPLENFRYSSLDASVKTCPPTAPPAWIFSSVHSKLHLLNSENNF